MVVHQRWQWPQPKGHVEVWWSEEMSKRDEVSRVKRKKLANSFCFYYLDSFKLLGIWKTPFFVGFQINPICGNFNDISFYFSGFKKAQHLYQTCEIFKIFILTYQIAPYILKGDHWYIPMHMLHFQLLKEKYNHFSCSVLFPF